MSDTSDLDPVTDDSVVSDPLAPGTVSDHAALHTLVAQANAEYFAPTAKLADRAMTSDLSIDEELVLHAIGWEPVELVTGVSVHSIPAAVWTWGQGEITAASRSYANAFAKASYLLHQQAASAGGHGVIGVRVERVVARHHVEIALVGTAVRPVRGKPIDAGSIFLSDLSGRDFVLLHNSGWMPVGLAVGASFVYAPRRSMGATLKQNTQNVELTNFTEAMYAARESAMERMQASAMALGGSGVVEVKVTEGPMEFAHHAIGFSAYGTVVKLAVSAHRHVGARVVVALDDVNVAFAASTLA